MLGILKLFGRKEKANVSICMNINSAGLIDSVKIVAQGEDAEQVAYNSIIATEFVADHL